MPLHSIHILFITSTIFFLSCNNKVKTITDPVHQYATEKFEKDFLCDYNATNEYVIISKAHKIKPSDPFPTLRFDVLEVKSMEVMFNDNLRGGKVSWLKDYILEAEALKGIPGPEGQSPKDNKYYYHVQNRKKFTGRFF